MICVFANFDYLLWAGEKMGNDNNVKNGKIQFGSDLYVLGFLMNVAGEIGPDDNLSTRALAIVNLFLLQWDISFEEISKATDLFTERSPRLIIEGYSDTILERIANGLMNHKTSQERLITMLAVISFLGNEVKEAQHQYISYFQNKFGMSTSDIMLLYQRGRDWIGAILGLTDTYVN